MIVQPVLIRVPFQPGLSGSQKVERQRRFARIALDHCAKRAGVPAGEWPQTAERVPIPRDGYYWSIAHKPRFAAAVISRSPVGIDIEAITSRDSDLTSAVASSEEWAVIKESRVPIVQAARGPEMSRDQEATKHKNDFVFWRQFFEVWTAKEAVLKANSAGIGGLKSCRLSQIDKDGRFAMTFEDRNFKVEHFRYAGHIAACTCFDSRLQWHVIEGIG
jgi:phosphopantetheinyl transferase